MIEVLVSEGDTVAVEDSLITLETDKASMDVPASPEQLTGSGFCLALESGETLLDQPLEWQILMRVGVKGYLAHPFQELAKTGVTGKVRTQH